MTVRPNRATTPVTKLPGRFPLCADLECGHTWASHDPARCYAQQGRCPCDGWKDEA